MAKQKRLYSLFEKTNGKWVRVTDRAYTKQTAIRVFQDKLLEGFFAGRKTELRPIV